MDWLDLGKKVASVGLPLLGTAIGGPAGGTIGGMVAGLLGCKDDPDEIAAAIDAGDPATISTLTEFQTKHRERLVELSIERARVESQERLEHVRQVNETMRAEVAAGHKWSGMWRPFWGFVSAVAFGVAIFGILFLCGVAIVQGKTELIKYVPELAFNLSVLFGIPGAILGVASWHRGQMQRVQSGDSKAGGLVGLINAIKK